MTTNEAESQTTLAGLSTLDDPLRRRLYAYVVGNDEPVSRDQAAAAVQISRTLTAYHLDKLTAVGLLRTSYARPAGRGGPGAGRPAKFYTRSQQELSLSVPPRDYELLAHLLAGSIDHDTSGAVRAAVNQAARQAGEQASEPGGDLMTMLSSRGYQPQTDQDGCIELHNCPFHRLVQNHQELVCGLNLHLIEGIITGTGREDAEATLAPRPGRCCVVVQANQPMTNEPSSTRTIPADDHR